MDHHNADLDRTQFSYQWCEDFIQVTSDSNNAAAGSSTTNATEASPLKIDFSFPSVTVTASSSVSPSSPSAPSVFSSPYSTAYSTSDESAVDDSSPSSPTLPSPPCSPSSSSSSSYSAPSSPLSDDSSYSPSSPVCMPRPYRKMTKQSERKSARTAHKAIMHQHTSQTQQQQQQPLPSRQPPQQPQQQPTEPQENSASSSKCKRLVTCCGRVFGCKQQHWTSRSYTCEACKSHFARMTSFELTRVPATEDRERKDWHFQTATHKMRVKVVITTSKVSNTLRAGTMCGKLSVGKNSGQNTKKSATYMITSCENSIAQLAECSPVPETVQTLTVFKENNQSLTLKNTSKIELLNNL